MLLRARTVLPICSPPIENGAVLINGGRIEAVAPFPQLRGSSAEFVDLGDSILLPGLINAHCHLDYTNMAGLLRPPRHFSDWIKAIVSLKAEWSYTDYAASWLAGAKMLLRSGTTTVVNIEAVPELLPDVLTSTPLRVVSCQEMLSVRSRQTASQMVEEAVNRLEALTDQMVGLSPHAPYTTSAELLRASASAARERGWLLTTHTAESADEFEMYQHARGAMFDWLKAQRDMSDCGHGSPLAHLARHGILSSNFLAVHVNYLAPSDAELLAQARSSVVHCPSSHAYFAHQPFPLKALRRAGVNICLGTDSMATMPRSHGEPFTLNMFSEMRRLAAAVPALTAEEILRMATTNAAQALGRTTDFGRLTPGALADVIAIPHSGHDDPFDAVLNHRGDVKAKLISGNWILGPNE